MSDLQVRAITTDGILVYLQIDAAEFVASLLAQYLTNHRTDQAAADCLRTIGDGIRDWKEIFEGDDE